MSRRPKRLIRAGGRARRQLCADAGDDQYPRPRAAAPAGVDLAGGERSVARPFPRAGARSRHPPAYRLDGDQARRGRGGPRRQPRLPDRARRRRSLPATTRSTCSTSTSPAARAIASRASTGRAIRAVVADLPWTRLGLTVCYDVRFPQLHRALARPGAEVLAVPAAFTRTTGEAHWHVLLRARAIETGSWVIAAAQGGQPRGRARDLRPFDDRRPVGAHRRGGRQRNPASSSPRSIRRRAPRRAAAIPALANERGFAPPVVAGGASWSRQRHDPLHAALRPRPRIRGVVPLDAPTTTARSRTARRPARSAATPRSRRR